jgi:hypothetical protein
MSNPTISWVRFLPAGNEEESETIQFPAKMIVCYTCDGTGKTVNPDIDGNGLTAEDFDQDPDFEEAYFAGAYDITCRTCKGKNVIAELDRERIERDPRLRLLLKLKDKQEADEARDDASEAWLRRAESGERY